MASTVAVLEAKLIANTRDFDRDMDQSESRMKGLAKTAGKAGLAGAVIGLGFAVKAGFGEFMEAQRVTAQTNAVIKSTGGVANVTAKEVGGLSEALMKKSGVDDEVIASGANVLLTFTKVRNEVGQGNDIFDQATKATLNLSVALGKDMSSSAIMVGKALNDPIKGMAAMGRAGVQFTAEQKETVKAMIAAGDTMGAQKVILKELETQFGGSAEAAGKTFGGQINIAKETLLNLAGQGVGKLMPYLIQFGSWIGGVAVPKIKEFVQMLTGSGGLHGAFSGVTDFIRDPWLPTIRSILGVFQDVFAAIVRVVNSKKEELKVIIDGIKAVISGIYLVIREVVVPALQFIFKKGGPFDIVFGLAIDIVAGLVKAIGGIVGGVRSAVAAVEKFWNGAGGKAFRAVFGAMEDAVAPLYALFKKIVDSVQWLIDNIKKIPIPNFGGGDTGSLPAPPGRQGDAHSPTYAGLNLMGASPVMAPFAAGAAGYGLRVTSGLRPGAITANGTPSDHGIGKALDVAGTAAGMAGFFKSLIGNQSVKQAFYDPLGSIFGGLWNSYREGGHSDHVHVATYDKGGVLRPGLTLAYNGTGRDEYISNGRGLTVNFNGPVWDQRTISEVVRDAIYQGRNLGWSV